SYRLGQRCCTSKTRAERLEPRQQMERGRRTEAFLDGSVFFSSSLPLRFDDLRRGITKGGYYFSLSPLPLREAGRGLESRERVKGNQTSSIVWLMLEVVGSVDDTDGAGARPHNHRLCRRAAGKEMNALQVV